jgi:gamma-glutamyltranspeptidase / glutathione hydrolase
MIRKILIISSLVLIGLPSLQDTQAMNPNPHLPQNATASNGMVATAHPLASRAGLDILKQGGTALDAAIASALALNVVEPQASGIGGGGFLLISREGSEPEMLDFREVAPQATALEHYYVDGKFEWNLAKKGGLAVGVPGQVAGFYTAWQKYGALPWEALFQPAIRLAEDGFPVTANLVKFIRMEEELLRQFPDSAAIYLPEGKIPEPGDILKNPDLANTFRLIASEGPDAFYEGQMTQAITEAVRKYDGVLAKEDLVSYQPIYRKPVQGNFKDYRIYSAPPPSSGGTHILQLLALANRLDVESLTPDSADYIHRLAEAMKWSFYDRERFMADPAFYDVPVEKILDPARLDKIVQGIDSDAARSSFEPLGQQPETGSGNTSHLSVVDKDGSVVAMTLTINYFFGSGITVPGYGFLLNDEMADFSFEPDAVNRVAPGKRPLSSMSPTLVFKEEAPVLSVGSPGGTRIITAVTQILLNMMVFEMGVDEAIEAPRFHCLSSDGRGSPLYLESRYSNQTLGELKIRGHEVEVKGAYDHYFGGAQAIRIQEDGALQGGADSRRDGFCAGY